MALNSQFLNFAPDDRAKFLSQISHPLALAHLKEGIFAEGDYFPGDLLNNVLSGDPLLGNIFLLSLRDTGRTDINPLKDVVKNETNTKRSVDEESLKRTQWSDRKGKVTG